MSDGPGQFGLDFGTTTTLLATHDQLLPLGELTEWMPSLVGLDDDGSLIVGEQAESAGPGLTIRSVKRAITKRWNDIRESRLAQVRRISADEVIVELLREVVARAWVRGVDIGAPVPVTVGCPAIWDSGQRQRFLRLLERAGVPARAGDLVDEPVAAGIAWLARQPRTGNPMRLVVFDMGGGTLDIAVIDVRGPDDSDIHLLAAVGRAEAGDSLDQTIADDIAADLGLADGGDPWQRELLLDAARRLKVWLTTEAESVVVLDRELFGAINEVWFGRDRLEELFAPQMDRAIELVLVALRAAHLTDLPPDVTPVGWPSPGQLLSGVDVMLLSGGMSRVPFVARRLREVLGPAALVTPAADPPEAAVVAGLTRAARYRRNTRYALGYHIVLEWDGDQRTIYEAHMPILESWWIERNWGGELRFLCTGRGLDLPGHGHGVLRAVPDSGPPPGASLNGASLDGYPVALNGDQFELAIYPSGRLRMIDATGVHEGRTRA